MEGIITNFLSLSVERIVLILNFIIDFPIYKLREESIIKKLSPARRNELSVLVQIHIV